MCASSNVYSNMNSEVHGKLTMQIDSVIDGEKKNGLIFYFSTFIKLFTAASLKLMKINVVSYDPIAIHVAFKPIENSTSISTTVLTSCCLVIS